MKQYKLPILFSLLTYLSSWTIWGTSYLLYKFNANYSLFGFLVFLGSCMPSLIALILTMVFYKSQGLTKFLKRLNIFHQNGTYCLLGVIMVTFYITMSLLFLNLLGFPRLSHIRPLYILQNFILILTIGGPIEEELGWRGLLLEEVHTHFNQCFSSIIVGIIWALWHIPLFFIPGSSQYGCPLLLFILHSILLSIIITKVFDKTNHCITFAIILHATSNTLTTSFITSSSSFSKYYTFLQVHKHILAITFILIILGFTLMEIIHPSSSAKALSQSHRLPQNKNKLLSKGSKS